jgi:predicted nucleotidyltransferase component of viral defense system
MLKPLQHEIVMKKILMDIYTNSTLAPALGFKGGTCLYFFYELNRFSTDLDFNLITNSLDAQALDKILKKHLDISEHIEKHFTWFWQRSYEKGSPKIKIEISKRDYPDTFVPQDFYGLTMQTMSKECMFAHKLCAITDRKTLQNRDLYDSWFMFENNFPINAEIIKIRTGKTISEYFVEVVDYIEKSIKQKTSILEGLGEVLDNKQKEWVKSHLLQKLLFELKIRISKNLD